MLALTAIDSLPPSGRIVVGLSGGLDSCVLLHRLAAEPSLHTRLLAVHIHHGLSANADAWAQHCHAYAKQLGVAFAMEEVQVDRNVASLELAARNARYQAFAKHLQEQDVLVTAHHQNDQAETFMLRLMRGAGMDGLSAMKAWSPQQHYFLWRPLLSYSRQQLEHYAAAFDLCWVEDESNQSEQFDRNFVRLQVLPVLQSRWPHAVNAISRATENLQDTQQLVAELIADDLQKTVRGNRLHWVFIQHYSVIRINAILRAWLHANAVQAVSSAQLNAMRNMMFSAQADATPLFELPNVSVRRYRDYLYLLPGSAETAAWRSPPEWLQWGDALPCGQLRVEIANSGSRVDCSKTSLEQLTVRFRSGAARIHLAKHAHSSDLKKLLQSVGCPPWWRPVLPLLYCGDELVCVPGIGVAQGWQAEADAPGWAISWDQFGSEPHETRTQT